MKLTEKDLHCIARLLQGSIYGERGNAFDGCAFCKYRCKTEKDPAPYFDEVMNKLDKKTGVAMLSSYGQRQDFPCFPYKRFLINANDEIKSVVNNYLAKGVSGAERQIGHLSNLSV